MTIRPSGPPKKTNGTETKTLDALSITFTFLTLFVIGSVEPLSVRMNNPSQSVAARNLRVTEQ
jgi:hypothetical protein